MALYRKYRPASFAEVVGQEQVTGPLSVALDTGRINHAYLFSGPRGCGKTSSARILARSLNCAEGPTSRPCGVCNSCVSLAPGGSGNLDVTELDAASHNGVEDMRELRDKAHYAPAESRYRVFIIDEAHMITPQGFNAMLKIVEEPPEHLIFIFATTEPEKVIGTIRSRTHHYPFRLLTPGDMRGLLQRTVESEGVHVQDEVYPLVIEAGGGSPRDSLSILDQLVAGSGPDGVSYDEALGLLGVTDLSLIDATIDCLAVDDKAGLFQVVDDVIEAGHEPRRFVTDLLNRLRDLMVLRAVPEAIEMGLVTAPTARAEILQEEATRFSDAQLAHLATQVNARISDMKGATSPRLLLEILIAHLLLPAAPVAAPGAAVAPVGPGVANGQGTTYERPSVRRAREAAERAAREASTTQNVTTPAAPQPVPQEQPQPVPQPLAQQPEKQPTQQQPAQQEPAPQPAQQPPAPQEAPRTVTPAAVPEDVVEAVRTEWARLRVEVGKRNKVAEIMLTEAHVLGLKEDTLVLGHNTGALAGRLNEASKNEVIVAVLRDEMGLNLKVHCVVGTNPEAMGFAPPAAVKKAWNPNETQAVGSAGQPPQASRLREPADSAEEPAQPTPTPEPTPTPQHPTSGAVWGAPAPIGGAPQAPKNPPTQQATPAPQPQQSAPTWGSPAPLGGPPAPVPPEAPEPAPEVVPQPEEPRLRRWEQAAARGQATMAQRDQRPQFSDGVPLPPEPSSADVPADPYDYPADEGIPDRSGLRASQPAPSPAPAGQPESAASQSGSSAADRRRAEEDEMLAASLEPGQLDRRDAKDIAMELLAKELGARPL
ncbi:DNA polymerase III subunit tau [Corynebacterium occultum]|uniref:DNA-directed DNA polymerase n=1 Tax=Corynebacterium occultum TaxID=2675219 RepID=A0A6B8W5P6_9CORY|nr:DNA polymerase III subunit gamma and tau [Corynebacterium occultum]QGU06236.1 DNA polymerase III subunit tau [Corynebacterium occultum]